jgi:hypothetical protein
VRAVSAENKLFLQQLTSLTLTPGPSPDQPSVGARRGENFKKPALRFFLFNVFRGSGQIDDDVEGRGEDVTSRAATAQTNR